MVPLPNEPVLSAVTESFSACNVGIIGADRQSEGICRQQREAKVTKGEGVYDCSCFLLVMLKIRPATVISVSIDECLINPRLKLMVHEVLSFRFQQKF